MLGFLPMLLLKRQDSIDANHATVNKIDGGWEVTFEPHHNSWFSVPLGQQGSGFLKVVIHKVSGPDGWYFLLAADKAGTHTSGGQWVQAWQTWLTAVGTSQPFQLGMQAIPGTPKGTYVPSGYVPMNSISRFGFNIAYADQPVTIDFLHPQLIKSKANFPWIDRFGQVLGANWASKMEKQSQFHNKSRFEVAPADASFSALQFDAYGGTTLGPKFSKSPHFRTQKVGNRWWLIDPDGHLFFSMGVDSVTVDDPTVVSNRSQIFNNLPENSGEFSKFYSPLGFVVSGPTSTGLQYDFARQNLEFRYGPNYRSDFIKEISSRFHNWGFNTIGNWSDQTLEQTDNLPYTATAQIYGDTRTLDGAPDPWLPSFIPTATESIESNRFAKNDSHCLGIFVDNEIAWGSFNGPGRFFYFNAALGSSPEEPAKQKLIGFLKSKYSSISSLNQSWQTQYSSWANLMVSKNRMSAAQLASGPMRADALHFDAMVYDKYFSTVAGLVHQLLPGALYLGCRLNVWTPECLAACSRYADVVSFNLYRPNMTTDVLNGMAVDKPVIVSEWSVPTESTGYFTRGPLDATSEQDRASHADVFLKSALKIPNVVGLHWFSYRDEPASGRTLDGENSAFGLVQITDVPYKTLIEGLRSTLYQFYLSQGQQ